MAPAPSEAPTPKVATPKAQDASTKSAAQVDPLDGAQVEDLEDEVRSGPSANWEVAYVWSFLEHFSDKVDWRKSNPTLPNVMVFEHALLDCSPPSPSPRTSNRVKPKPVTAVAQRAALANGGKGNGRAASPASSLSSLEDDDVDAEEKAAVLAAVDEPIDPVPAVYPAEAPQPPESDLIRQVCEMFQENLKPIKELTDYHGKKTWFHFLINFVSNRFNQDPYFRGGFRWETNLLRTKGLKPGQESERKFWTLRWEDKIHLMRILVDYQLVHAPALRNTIKDKYDLGNQRIAKRDPASNDLVVLPAGTTSTGLTLYHLDSSPRLYASCDPYNPDAAWICLSSTLKGYKAFVKTLAAPTKADKKAQTLRGPFAKAAAAGAGAKKPKGKEDKEDPRAEERITRARLEADLQHIMEYEQAMDAIEQRKVRAAERAATRDARMARSIQRLSYSGTSTRSSRRAARGDTSRVHYDDPGEDDVEVDEDEGGQGRRKRRRTGAGAGTADGSVAGSEAGGDDAASVGGSSRRSSARPSIPGERRSNRLQLRDQHDDDESVDGASGEGKAEENGGGAEGDGDADGVKAEDGAGGAEGEPAEGVEPSTVPATPAEGDAPPVEPKPDVNGGNSNGHVDNGEAKPMDVDGEAAA